MYICDSTPSEGVMINLTFELGNTSLLIISLKIKKSILIIVIYQMGCD